MSASGSSESSETKIEKTTESCNIKSRYALYLFNYNKHASISDTKCEIKENLNIVKDEPKSSDIDEPTFCLSLLEGNLGADLETVVRCYLLKSLRAQDDLSFENEGKYTVLQSSDDSDETFGCYYHRISKTIEELDKENVLIDEKASKMHTFFICLIGPANGIMESYP